MLNDVKMDELLEKVDSRYGLVLASAKRARQINEYTATLGLNDALGIPGPQVHTRSQHPITIALEELRQDKLQVAFREPAEEEEEIGAADGDDFVSPPSGAGVPVDSSEVDTGAPEDEGEGSDSAA